MQDNKTEILHFEIDKPSLKWIKIGFFLKTVFGSAAFGFGLWQLAHLKWHISFSADIFTAAFICSAIVGLFFAVFLPLQTYISLYMLSGRVTKLSLQQVSPDQRIIEVDTLFTHQTISNYEIYEGAYVFASSKNCLWAKGVKSSVFQFIEVESEKVSTIVDLDTQKHYLLATPAKGPVYKGPYRSL